MSDARVALYLEEREPSLGAALLSAVELRAAPAPASPAIARSLVADAAARLATGDLAQAALRLPDVGAAGLRGAYHAAFAHLLDGHAKAMVVTDSRKAAVRYKLAIDAYIAERGQGAPIQAYAPRTWARDRPTRAARQGAY